MKQKDFKELIKDSLEKELGDIKMSKDLREQILYKTSKANWLKRFLNKEITLSLPAFALGIVLIFISLPAINIMVNYNKLNLQYKTIPKERIVTVGTFNIIVSEKEQGGKKLYEKNNP
ncbi:hypothetical protein [Desnuesiella massiliensis]|uniref:hypothetical protein n=1 Tax=Desnuesiella massiliensis TaxID=1650662 RepID=UPI0006E16137|nr:hypothetical protein [Desnuesiella massiliensis]